MVTRVASAAALVAAATIVGVLLLDVPTSQTLRIRLQNASQLVKGNLVEIGGVRVGDVRDLRLTSDGLAEAVVRIDDEAILPLHEGTTAIVRSYSISAVAGRAVVLAPGPTSAPELADGSIIPVQRTTSAVEIDAVIAMLDARTRNALQHLTHGTAEAVSGVERDLARGLAALSPAAAQTHALVAELSRDTAAFERLLLDSAAVLAVLSERDEDVDATLASTATAAASLASTGGALDAAVRRTPRLLAQTRRTARGLTAALPPVARALRDAQPAAAPLVRALDRATPVLQRAIGPVRDLRRLTPTLRRVLDGLPALDRVAATAFPASAQAVGDLRPVLAGIRPFAPDVVSGLTNGFGGSVAGYYDANGHYARISLTSGPTGLVGAPSSLGPATSAGRSRRCPGAAEPPHPDGSNPWVPTPETCVREPR